MSSRREFIKKTSKASAAVYLGSIGFSAKSYGRILGANDRVNVGVVGFSDRFRQSHLPCFKNHYKELNFDIIAVSDIWKIRREEGKAFLKKELGHDITACINNDELYKIKDIDAVFISTADFQQGCLC
jgi:predicted dehydrogenase